MPWVKRSHRNSRFYCAHRGCRIGSGGGSRWLLMVGDTASVVTIV